LDNKENLKIKKNIKKDNKKVSKKSYKTHSYRKKVSTIIIICFFCLILISYFSYWIYSISKINQFANIELESSQILLNTYQKFIGNSTNSNFITINDTKIHYIEKGSGSNCLIFLHGFGGGWFSYRFNLDFFADNGFKVYAIDFKGFGFSERKIDSDYSYKSQAELVSNFIIEKKLKNIVLIGHSMGGQIALITFDLLHKKGLDVVKKIILIDSVGIDGNFNSILKIFLNQSFIDILYLNLIVNKQRFTEIFSSAYFNKDKISDEWINFYLTPFKVKNTNKVYLSLIKTQKPYDISGILSKMDLPVLIIWGGNDSWINLENAYKFNNYVKSSKLVIIPQAGHLPMEEKPEIFNDIVVNFLTDSK